MFTGIIESVAPIISISKSAEMTIFKIKRPHSFDDLKESSSIACNGICLTVIALHSDWFEVQVMNETFKKTTAITWKVSDMLNLERALKIGSRLDGHWVQGHIDKSAKVLDISKIKDALYIQIQINSDDKKLIIAQGSIAVNGVSLTIADIGDNWFKVALIGHTIENSNLARLKPGNLVNIEFDIIGKYILNLNGNKAISREWLYEQGF